MRELIEELARIDVALWNDLEANLRCAAHTADGLGDLRITDALDDIRAEWTSAHEAANRDTRYEVGLWWYQPEAERSLERQAAAVKSKLDELIADLVREMVA